MVKRDKKTPTIQVLERTFSLLEMLTSRANVDHISRLMRVPEPADAWSTQAQVEEPIVS